MSLDRDSVFILYLLLNQKWAGSPITILIDFLRSHLSAIGEPQTDDSKIAEKSFNARMNLGRFYAGSLPVLKQFVVFLS